MWTRMWTLGLAGECIGTSRRTALRLKGSGSSQPSSLNRVEVRENPNSRHHHVQETSSKNIVDAVERTTF